jgi:hypothetical protein
MRCMHGMRAVWHATPPAACPLGHRLQLENLLLATKDDISVIKIADFGLAKQSAGAALRAVGLTGFGWPSRARVRGQPQGLGSAGGALEVQAHSIAARDQRWIVGLTAPAARRLWLAGLHQADSRAIGG